MSEKSKLYPNLTPWPKGVSGNPSGRPKKPITDRYKVLLERALPKSRRLALHLRPGATYADAVVAQQIERAIDGSYNDVREIREAIEGKAPQAIELSGGDSPIHVEAAPRLDLRKLSKDQLLAYKEILARCAAPGRDD